MAYSRFECKVTASLFIIWGILLLSTPVDCFAVSRKQRGLFSRAPFPRALRKTRFPTFFTLESTDTGTRVYAALSDSSNGDKPLFTQVISDVDDTLKSSGGVNVAGVALGGIDVQYPRGEMYPGVAEFMLQMSLGVASSPTVSNPVLAVAPPKIAILTARAEEFKIALQLKDDSPLVTALRQAGETAGVSNWGVGPVLYGSVAEWIAQDRKGFRKFTNFERLLQQDPTGIIFQYVYVGDTGELDQEAGETMLREYPEVVKAVFLHVVADKIGSVTVPPPKIMNGRPVIFFRTYVGAAVAAVQLGFMSMDGLDSVIAASCQRLADVPRESDKWADLERDIARAQATFVF